MNASRAIARTGRPMPSLSRLRERGGERTTNPTGNRRCDDPAEKSVAAARRRAGRPPCRPFPPGFRPGYAATAAKVAGAAEVTARASSRSSAPPSPRQALPCMQASVCGFSPASRCRMAAVSGACAK